MFAELWTILPYIAGVGWVQGQLPSLHWKCSVISGGTDTGKSWLLNRTQLQTDRSFWARKSSRSVNTQCRCSATFIVSSKQAESDFGATITNIVPWLNFEFGNVCMSLKNAKRRYPRDPLIRYQLCWLNLIQRSSNYSELLWKPVLHEHRWGWKHKWRVEFFHHRDLIFLITCLINWSFILKWKFTSVCFSVTSFISLSLCRRKDTSL